MWALAFHPLVDADQHFCLKKISDLREVHSFVDKVCGFLVTLSVSKSIYSIVHLAHIVWRSLV